jgi:predicted DNA-binding transcriptional regulator AlpA
VENDDWLTPKEVRAILKMDDPRTFAKFRQNQPLFPKPFSIGTSGKKPIWRWSRSAVLAFMRLMEALGQQGDGPAYEEDE